MRRIEDLKNQFEGTAAILCTGPSVLKVAHTIPKDAFTIGVNRRSLDLANKLNLSLDMIVANDPWEFDPLLREPQYSKIDYKLSRNRVESSYFIDRDLWHNGLTSSTAISVACLVGFDEVLIYGLDLYAGNKCYFNQDSFDKKQDTVEWANQDMAWGSIMDDVPRSYVLKMVSGHYWLADIINNKRVK